MVAVARPGRGLGTGFGRVAWTRGPGCLPVADHLGDAPAIQATGDLRDSCVTQRIDLLVTRKISSFDLVPIVVPYHVDLEHVTAVTAAVADGAHSPLAAAVASRLGATLGVPAELATVYRTPDELPAAHARLARLAEPHPDLARRAANEPTATGLIDSLSPGTLLVVGAPGGSWLQRQLYGTGHRLLVTAPCGAVLVRTAPRRCYHDATDATADVLSRHLTVGDARRLITHRVVPVAEDGILVGIVRASTLADADATVSVAAVMELPVAVTTTEPAAAVAELDEFFEHAPVPVVDAAGHLIGTISS